jgi:hypothetical protein
MWLTRTIPDYVEMPTQFLIYVAHPHIPDLCGSPTIPDLCETHRSS